MSVIFISHSSKDDDAAERIRQWLDAAGYGSVFLDFDPERGIPGGKNWDQELYKRLRQCRAVVALLSPDWLASKWCFYECHYALAEGKAFFPLLIAPCNADEVAKALSRLQLIDLTRDAEDGRRRLLSGLASYSLAPSIDFKVRADQPPYPGLASFTWDDAGLFFGRDNLIHDSIQRLDAMRRSSLENRLLLLLGPSGSGKSSLMQAGILARLRAPGRKQDWLVLPLLRRGRTPILRTLALSLGLTDEARLKALLTPPPSAEADRVRESATQAGAALARAALDLLERQNIPEATVLLPLDQTEELLHARQPDESIHEDDWSLMVLRALLETARSPVMILATLRSDALGLFQTHQALSGDLFGKALRFADIQVDPLARQAFRVVITAPAERVGIRINPEFVERLVEDASRGKNSLPLLAYTLNRLWQRSQNELRLDHYLEMGGIDHVVRDRAESVTKHLPSDSPELEALRGAFVPGLVRVDADGRVQRRTALLAKLPEEARQLLDKLADERLLIKDEETIEIAHEALLAAWPRLMRWIDEDRDKLRAYDAWLAAALEWSARQTREDLLIHRGERLRETEALGSEKRFCPEGPSPAQAYLRACREAENAREAAAAAERERRIRDAEKIAEEQAKRAEAEKSLARSRGWRLVLVSLFAVAAGIAAVWALWLWAVAQEREVSLVNANHQLSIEREKVLAAALVSQAEVRRSPEDLPTALALAAHAHRLRPGPRSDSLIRNGLHLFVPLARRRQLPVVTHLRSEVGLDPSGDVAVSGREQKGEYTLRIFGLADAVQRSEIKVPVVSRHSPHDLLVSDKAERVALLGTTHVKVVDTLKQEVLYASDFDLLDRPALSPDGRFLAVGRQQWGIKVCDGEQGKVVLQASGSIERPRFTEDDRFFTFFDQYKLRAFETKEWIEIVPSEDFEAEHFSGPEGAGATPEQSQYFVRSANGRFAASWREENVVEVIDLQHQDRVFRTAPVAGIQRSAFSGDGRVLGVVEGSALRTFDTGRWKEVSLVRSQILSRYSDFLSDFECRSDAGDHPPMLDWSSGGRVNDMPVVAELRLDYDGRTAATVVASGKDIFQAEVFDVLQGRSIEVFPLLSGERLVQIWSQPLQLLTSGPKVIRLLNLERHATQDAILVAPSFVSHVVHVPNSPTVVAVNPLMEILEWRLDTPRGLYEWTGFQRLLGIHTYLDLTTLQWIERTDEGERQNVRTGKIGSEDRSAVRLSDAIGWSSEIDGEVRFSPSGDQAAVRLESGALCLLSLAAHSCSRELEYVDHFEFSEDGESLVYTAIPDEGWMRVKLPDGEAQDLVHGKGITEDEKVAMAGQWVVALSAADAPTEQALRIIDAETGKEARLPLPGPGYEMALSRDGKKLALAAYTGEGNSVISVVDVVAARTDWSQHTGEHVESLAWTRDGTALAVATQQLPNDGSRFIVVDLASSEPGVAVDVQVAGLIEALAFEDDGARLRMRREYSGYSYIESIAWRPGDVIAEACRVLGGDMSTEKWHEIMGPIEFTPICGS